ncbi:MAG: hypothetical protein H7Y32_03970 [Chloroflexales bacterium]|nr:hypothetical protein [Chloroflexales bacterium]
MIQQIVLVTLAALALTSCGQVEPGASLDTTPIGAAPTSATGANTPTDGPVLPTQTAAPPAATQAATALPGLQPTFTSLPAGQGDAASDAVVRAQTALATALGVAPQTLSLVQVEDQEWSDSGLGCPNPDEAYMQVIIAGQRIVFSDGSNTYAVHTDGRGNRMLWCNGGKPMALK